MNKEQVIYALTLIVAVITAAIPFLQALQGVVPIAEAGEFALVITILGLAVPFMVNLIGILNSTYEMKKAELAALKK